MIDGGVDCKLVRSRSPAPAPGFQRANTFFQLISAGFGGNACLTFRPQFCFRPLSAGIGIFSADFGLTCTHCRFVGAGDLIVIGGNVPSCRRVIPTPFPVLSAKVQVQDPTVALQDFRLQFLNGDGPIHVVLKSVAGKHGPMKMAGGVAAPVLGDAQGCVGFVLFPTSRCPVAREAIASPVPR